MSTPTVEDLLADAEAVLARQGTDFSEHKGWTSEGWPAALPWLLIMTMRDLTAELRRLRGADVSAGTATEP